MATFDAIRPATTPSSPPLSLDRQVRLFVRDVSGLAGEVENTEAREHRLLDAPGLRVYSNVDASTGRTYYFDSSRQLCTWQQPTVAVIERWADTATQATAAQPVSSSSSLLAIRERVARMVHAIALLVDQLVAAVEGQAEAMRVSAGLLRLELRIRREDWQAGAVSDEYATERLTDLLARVEEELAAASSQSSTTRPPLALPADVGTKEAVEPETTSSGAQTSDTAAQAQLQVSASVATELTSTADTTDPTIPTAPPPPGVRRRAGVVSKPPSNPTDTQSPPLAMSPPASSYPTAAHTSNASPPPLQSYHTSGSVASAGKRRLEDAKGAVGAMVQRWKAVKREAEDEGGRAEQERLRQQEQRMRQAEAEVRSSGGAANNPNLIAVSGDWRTRMREKQQQQLQQE